MEYSFYGGRPGKSFVISKTFNSYEEMAAAFSRGLNYQEVVYGEYVLINTTDPRDMENGRLYKRGYEGPEYVGCIEGPPGYSPHVKIENFNTIDTLKNLESDMDKDYLYSEGEFIVNKGDLVPGKAANGSFNDSIKWKTLSCRRITSFFYSQNKALLVKLYKDEILLRRREVTFENSLGQEEKFFYDEEVYIAASEENSSANLIRFIKERHDNFTETGTLEIDEAKVKQRRATVGYKKGTNYNEEGYDFEEQAEETIADIGFQFPYHFFDWEANSISPYENRTDNTKVFEQSVSYGTLISDEDTSHPFYSDMKLKVPHGIKGDSLKGLKVIPASEYQKLKESNSGYYEAVEGITDHSQWEDTYNGLDNDLPNATINNPEKKDRQILVYEYYDYRNNSNGAKITKYLGDYNMIEEISADDEGSIKIKYTHDDAYIKEKWVTWITGVNLNTDNGILTVTYNNDKINGSNQYTAKLDYITGIEISENGNVTYTHSTKSNGQSHDTSTQTPLRWIADFEAPSLRNNNRWQKVYNDGTKTDANFKNIDNIEIDDNFHIKINYNDGTSQTINDSLKVDSTLSIAFNITEDSQTGYTVESHINYLNNRYPNGLTNTADGKEVEDDWMKGKIITIGSTSGIEADNSKKFYAFNYDMVNGVYKKWYYLGSIGEISPDEVYKVAINPTSSELSNKMASLKEGGLCFILSTAP